MTLLVACNGDDDTTDTTDTGATTPAPTLEPTETASPTETTTEGGDDTSGPYAIADTPVALEVVADGLTAPVDFAAPDDGSGRLFVVEQTGTIRVISPDGEVLDEPFLDVTDRLVEMDEGYTERGLLGLAFHPQYADNGRFFVYYSAPLAEGAPEGWDHTSHLSEFQVSADDENVADAGSEQILMTVDQPQSNHNGGHITFGLDGYLYIPLGDGGGANDTDEGHTEGLGNGQDLTNLLGSILRIDVDTPGEGGQAYSIPQDNPFVDREDVPSEIWAYGVRNPYDISVDSEGEYSILVSDAGQERFEEVSIANAGDNLGWNIREGVHCFDPENADTPPEQCADTGADGEPLVHPVIEYDRSNFGTVITGAYVYRGTELTEYQGQLFFVEWNSAIAEGADGAVFVAEPGGQMAATGVDEGLWEFERVELQQPDGASEEGAGTGFYITAIAADATGELYILANTAATPEEGGGSVYRLVPAQ
jgi:glucose/arabinose dehydrogenase